MENVFIDLNNACPKNSFPLPKIDQLVNSIAGHELLTFMDAFSSYNQILMKEEDQEPCSLLAKAYIATKSCRLD